MEDLSEVKVTDRFSLSGKNFLITGGDSDIGSACAKVIAQLGGGVAIVDTVAKPVEDFRTWEKLSRTKTFYTRGDVTNQTSLEQAFVDCVRETGQLHGEVTAASVVNNESFLKLTVSALKRRSTSILWGHFEA